MKTLKILIQVIASLVLITVGVNNISKPSDIAVTFGALSIMVGIFAFTFFVAKPIIKKL